MICGNSWASTTVKVVFTCGLAVGAVVVSPIADRLVEIIKLT